MSNCPARAGFTGTTRSEKFPAWDHPRSRGVYASSSRFCSTVTGSSPLARGLPERASPPARCPPDHPRSRGVYRPEVDHGLYSEGSSPLARGLRPQRRLQSPKIGIIPARAGFTQAIRAGHRTHQDHPRSRGVYKPSEAEPQLVAGSSPLARGLPHSHTGGRIVGRIIPARAGFTPAQPERVRTVADHPRSRGVYVDVTAYSSKERGSSPLARGLLSVDLVDAGGVGIIPARAGFTDWRASSGPSPADHPRSRGVYASRTGRAHSRPGSSPLARGLPLQGLIRVTLSGIIPARAGFT